MVRPADDLPLMSDVREHGGLLFLSGRAAVDPATFQVRGSTFAEQLRIVLDDCRAVLGDAGSDLAHVLRVECWLLHRSDFPAWNAAWSEAFAAPRPARSTFLVAGLPIEGLLVELQLTAAVAA
jgi:2-iminobutanoate/2-iminopropanoate deaminase